MQSNHYTGSFKRPAEWLLKITITLMCVWFIFQKIEPGSFNLLPFIKAPEFLLILFVTIVLMLANWFLEAWKWRISIPDEKLTIWESLSAILGGLAMNWILPLTLGDAGGRLANVRNYKKTLYALVINRGIMFLFSSIYGITSLLFYFKELNSYSFFCVILSGLSISIFYIKYNRKKDHATMPNTIVKKVFLLSVLRYFVFSFQLYLLIAFFNPSLSTLVVVLGIGWIFFFRSFVPSLFGNFGVREASALIFFEQYLSEASLILIPCMLIWVINTVVPSFFGAFSILKLRVNIAQ